MMSKNYIIDCLSFILFKTAIFLFGLLPKGFSLFIARRLGEAFYLVDFKHKCRVYANIKRVLSGKKSPAQLNKITRGFYKAFLQNIVEIFFIPHINKEYLKKYITIEGFENIADGFKNGKGVILLAVHSGSWELSNIISANMGFAFNMLVRDQGKFSRIEKLLNSYRLQKGCKIIQRKNQTRQIIEALKNNEAIGMTLDQGGKTGCLVNFFGRLASMSTGAVRLALKYQSAIVPVHFTRIKGQYVRIDIGSAFVLKNSGQVDNDIKENIQRLVNIFEKYIMLYPEGYLWTYKIWKYGLEREVLILHDGKAGHIRQSQAAANIVRDAYRDRGISCLIRTQQIKFRHSALRNCLLLGSLLADNYHCQGCLFCLRHLLEEDTYRALLNYNPDVIVSCGSSLAPLNFVLSKENQAKSIVIMKPSIVGTKRFNLVIAPRHDRLRPKSNIVITEAALNLIDDKYLKEQAQRLVERCGPLASGNKPYLGLLLGGNSKNFQLKKEEIIEVVKQLKSAALKLNADILVTTSRRTPPAIEKLLKEAFNNEPCCKLLIIANERNIPEAVGGILGLSKLLICSPESISMISEALNSRKHLVVFESAGLSQKHRMFLENLSINKYIYLTEPSKLEEKIEVVWHNRPPVVQLQDVRRVFEAVSRII